MTIMGVNNYIMSIDTASNDSNAICVMELKKGVLHVIESDVHRDEGFQEKVDKFCKLYNVKLMREITHSKIYTSNIPKEVDVNTYYVKALLQDEIFMGSAKKVCDAILLAELVSFAYKNKIRK